MKIIELLGIFVLMCGVILIYDARPIAKKRFSYGDQNEATHGLKITGFALSIIGAIIMIIV